MFLCYTLKISLLGFSASGNSFYTQIDDFKTLRAATENDLRSAGLKMGDIIKIRTLLENQMISGSNKDLESSLSSTSTVEDIEKRHDKDDKPLEFIKVHVRFSRRNALIQMSV